MINSFALDTNLFFNLQSGLQWGGSSKEVIEKFNQYATILVQQKKAFFYMTPNIVDEMKSFFTDEPDYLNAFFTNIIVKSPDSAKGTIGANVLREFVEETRNRAYRGMKVAEEEIDVGAKLMMGKDTMSAVDYQKEIGAVITKFRERFRQATRFNFIDSAADIDLILLAREVDGALVSADEGVMRWGRMIGINEVSPSQFHASLEALQ
ncbi:RNA ligase partner protein [Candidatus Roizmanbacteria bacterium RIFCSPHIGHO2_01_FULL_39_12b]|uniref:RNA ligase partner protein n=1 Tax=Candidatus Roizmanbacteria bacterium RIFCSPHIGHO2_01_FULL_39_12b TaxID=1802030 RepID=A0A1F7G8Z6_9BACT|nr:MAG: RNA ligase partner protein [Candidatus Roizmanbacteria bacterium RIFCSPHIGHO2_01_FULL_39_12b]OGK46018.1 MAG: RNA ligase partner protein [Candidatus Roizmanbacteria bacterium RIFCSPLOWO2_01_FULL_39_19]